MPNVTFEIRVQPELALGFVPDNELALESCALKDITVSIDVHIPLTMSEIMINCTAESSGGVTGDKPVESSFRS